jgi:hypothetical protein
VERHRHHPALRSPIDELAYPTNTIRRGDLTVDEVTHLIQHHNLPEGTVSDVQNFQRVFSQLPDFDESERHSTFNHSCLPLPK